jgi:hypothetical protein
MVNMIESSITASWVAASSASQSRGMEVEGYLIFGGLLVAGGSAGLLCTAWMRAPLRRTGDTPAERQGRFERRRAQLCLGFSLVLYYAAALPVEIIRSGWAAVDPPARRSAAGRPVGRSPDGDHGIFFRTRTGCP